MAANEVKGIRTTFGISSDVDAAVVVGEPPGMPALTVHWQKGEVFLCRQCKSTETLQHYLPPPLTNVKFNI